jgi:protein gp37
MSDFFHEDIPLDYLSQMADVMERADWHQYQILTKRSERMMKLLGTPRFYRLKRLPHVWWGVSVENKKYGLPRIDHLRKVGKHSIRFLSIEPLLEDLGSIDLRGISWVIVGGESDQGRGYRPMDPSWAESIRRQCHEQGVPFFFKQMGGKERIDGVAGGDRLNGMMYQDYPKRLELPLA